MQLELSLRCLIPVVRDVVEIKFEDRPKSIGHERRISIIVQPVRVCDNRSSPERRTIYSQRQNRNIRFTNRETDHVEDDPMHP